MDIGKRLKDLRLERGLSQYQLSIKSGVSQSFLSSIESEKKSPTVNTLEKICISLGLSLAEFFSDEYCSVPDYLKGLVNEARHLDPEQSKLLADFLSCLRKS